MSENELPKNLGKKIVDALKDQDFDDAQKGLCVYDGRNCAV